MIGKTMRFRAVAGHMVVNETAAAARVRRYIGWKYSEVEPGLWGFVLSKDADEVPFHEDYPKYLREGALLPADEDTAKACGVEFKKPAAAPEIKKGGS